MTAAAEPPSQFNVNLVDSARLRVGDEFWSVYCPQRIPMTESQRGWALVHYVVVEYHVQHGKGYGPLITGFQEVGEPQAISYEEALDLWRRSQWRSA